MYNLKNTYMTSFKKRYTLHYATYEKALSLINYLHEKGVEFDICAFHYEPFELCLEDNHETYKFRGEDRIKTEIEKLIPFNFDYNLLIAQRVKEEILV